MPFRPDRRRRAGRYLEWKIGLFSVAAVLALVGIGMDDRRLTGAAIALLGVGVLLRFLPGAEPVPAEDDEESDGDVGPGPDSRTQEAGPEHDPRP